jgi:hypothetical protein
MIRVELIGRSGSIVGLFGLVVVAVRGGVVVVVVGVGDEVVVDDLDLPGPSALALGAGGVFFLGLLLDVLVAAWGKAY